MPKLFPVFVKGEIFGFGAVWRGIVQTGEGRREGVLEFDGAVNPNRGEFRQGNARLPGGGGSGQHLKGVAEASGVGFGFQLGLKGGGQGGNGPGQGRAALNDADLAGDVLKALADGLGGEGQGRRQWRRR